MKSLILALVLFPVVAFADCRTDISNSEVKEAKNIDASVPQNLQGAKYIIVLIDGSQSELSSAEFKLVRRKQERIVTKETVTKTVSCQADPKRNRVSGLLGNVAQGGLNRNDANPETVEVESNVGVVGGVMYQRLLTDRLSLGVQVQTSETALGVVGVEF
jgi:hypothetical protein